MKADSFYRPTDLDALRMENELLAFEITFLNAQLGESGRVKEESERVKEESERVKEESERMQRRLEEMDAISKRLASRLAEAERAEQDIVLLLRRLTRSPLGPVLRLGRSFRVLERRYLSTDD